MNKNMYGSGQLGVALDCRNNLGESPVWDEREGVLWWTNIHEAEVWKWDPFANREPRVVRAAERVGALGLRGETGLVLALESGFALMDARSGKVEVISRVESELPTTRLNDGRVDPAGRFVCGGMDEGRPQSPLSALYSLESDHTTRRLLAGVSCSNSLCWSCDGQTLYFTDMPSRRIEAFDYDVDSGALSNRRLFASLAREPGLADGSVVDAEDCLWNAQWGGGKVARYTPDGAIDREVFLPVSNPTCLAFGGPNLDILFVTTAWLGLSERERALQPHAGSIFAFRPGVTGKPEYRYAG